MARSIQMLRTSGCGGETEAMRSVVLAAGARLGWGPTSVASFAEALTGTPWDECETPELSEVLDEYTALLRAIDAKRSRKGGASWA